MYVSGRYRELKSLSKLIREAADHAFWLDEVEKVGVLIGCQEREDVELAWQAVSDIIDSIAILAFEYRNESEALVPVLKEWYADQQIRLRVRLDLKRNYLEPENTEPLSERIVMTILWRLLCKIESAYEEYEVGLQSNQLLCHVEPPKLNPESAKLAQAAAAHIQKAVRKVTELQSSMHPASFEFDIYQNILEAAFAHFEAMGMSQNDREEAA